MDELWMPLHKGLGFIQKLRASYDLLHPLKKYIQMIIYAE